MNAGTDSISRNTAFAFATQLTSAAFTAGVTLYLVRALGPSGYGVFALAVAIGAMLVLLADLGVTQSAERFIAERRSQPGAVAALLGDALRLKLIAAAVACGALFALAGPIADAYGEHDLDLAAAGDRRCGVRSDAAVPLPRHVRGAGPRVARLAADDAGERGRGGSDRRARRHRRRRRRRRLGTRRRLRLRSACWER